MTYTIQLDQMRFYAHHGCYAEEQRVGNWFEIFLTLRVENNTVAQTDNVADTLNYLDAYDVVRREMEQPSHTLEHVAARIAAALRKTFPAEQLKGGSLKICKMAPPVGGAMKSVGVELDF